ncbi:hypothetical protein SD70_21750 [Gordoniibacillus kamchatkensis]|uniref:SiaC family regulatory phosphoprotein domain-containing protein n=1 Tax=Gordoniibacillus kamchatkensis TaxID=1590651 RepID=A0ABR5ADV6_9BACL|nr:hypothetical protein SD70_21750 [Paenibacillus sp. VKM B-2647]
MEPISLQSSRTTPEVRFDPERATLKIRGESYPENAFEFYEPLLRWADEYLAQLSADSFVRTELELPYINTSSTKCFMLLLEKLEAAYQNGKTIEVYWYYDEDNESELECAEELKEDLTLPFHIIPKSEG